jgi:TatD DNase family protein
MLIDSHCHLDFPEFHADREQVLERMRAAGVSHALCISVNLEEFPAVAALAETHCNLWATCGIHPDYPDVREASIRDLLEGATHPRVIGIGETGLDYFRLQGDLAWQRSRFRTHVRAARACGKPLIVHTRAAAADTLAILREEGASECGGVMHCFTEDWDTARACLDLGFYISFSGIVTFKSATSLREVARRVPLDRILVETDAPYLAPVPHRGKRNEPAFVTHTAAFLALLLKIEIEKFEAVTTQNFERLFSISLAASEGRAS